MLHSYGCFSYMDKCRPIELRFHCTFNGAKHPLRSKSSPQQLLAASCNRASSSSQSFICGRTFYLTFTISITMGTLPAQQQNKNHKANCPRSSTPPRLWYCLWLYTSTLQEGKRENLGLLGGVSVLPWTRTSCNGHSNMFLGWQMEGHSHIRFPASGGNFSPTTWDCSKTAAWFLPCQDLVALWDLTHLTQHYSYD